MFSGFSINGNSIYNIIPLLKENVHLYPCPWLWNNYADAYFQSRWEDMALEVTMSSVKSTDATCMIHSSQLAAQLPWLVNLASLMCDVVWILSGRVSVLHSVVTGSISSVEDHGIHCWWDLISSKQLSSVSVCRAQGFAGFSGQRNLIYYIIPQLKKRKCTDFCVFLVFDSFYIYLFYIYLFISILTMIVSSMVFGFT